MRQKKTIDNLQANHDKDHYKRTSNTTSYRYLVEDMFKHW